MSPPGDLVARFEPVSLQELDDRAALQRRVTTKYLLDRPLLERLLAGLAGDHDALEIDGRRTFTYDSVYFDTPELGNFRAHAEGRRPRLKVRSRLYADTGLCAFELKVKLRDGETAKESLDQDPGDHGRLTQRARSFLGEQLGRLLGGAEIPELRPTLTTRFRRATVVARGGQERVTADTDLDLVAAGGGAVRLLGDHAIVEVKSDGGDETADRLLREAGIEPVKLSKYRVGVALLLATDPDPQLGGEPERWFRPAGR